MKIKNISLGKEFKVGLPNYSNLTLRCDINWELGENEEPKWDSMWDEINHQLYVQSGGIDDSWISNKEYREFFKVNIKTNKGGEDNE